MVKIREVVDYLEDLAPPSTQEEYDNSGLLVGNLQNEVTGVLITLDTTEQVIHEALKKGCNLIISHHPIIFRGIKRLTGRNYVERTIIQAVQNNLAIYAIHTNLDNAEAGVNAKICQRLGLIATRILAPKGETQAKLVSFVPSEQTESVLDALHEIGAGIIGNYDHCSFRSEGIGRYRPNEKANPHIGSRNKMENSPENRIEVVFPTHLQSRLIQVLKDKHPYEEVAYYVHPLLNPNPNLGAGKIGELADPMDPEKFLEHLKLSMDLECIRHTEMTGQPIRKVAVCGGAGSFLLTAAIEQGADAFVSSDFKYHEFFDADRKILITDIGHYESEAFTKELLGERLSEKFSSFALNLSQNTNPVKYF